MFKLNAKFDVNLLLYLFSRFECGSHLIHMLIQRDLPLPLTSTVKSSWFTHLHSSLLSLARLHWCHSNCSCYFNNGWTFSRQTSYFLLLLHKGPRSNNIAVGISIPSAQILVFTYHCAIKEPGLIGEMSVLGLEQKKYKMNMKQLVAPESKAVLMRTESSENAKVWRTNLMEQPVAKSGTIWASN